MLHAGIILAAGYGVRFLPLTKVLPKELLPLAGRPAIDYIVEEFVEAGISNIVIVISARKRLIRSYYQDMPWLRRHLQHSGQGHLNKLLALPKARLRFVCQRHMGGTGHALLQASRYLQPGPVVVAYPDDVHWGNPSLTKQLIMASNEEGGGKNVIATIHNPSHPERYGMLRLRPSSALVEDIVEKPSLDTLPSQYASIGRFLYQPAFFDYLREGWRRHRRISPQQEYYHIYALRSLMQRGQVLHHQVIGEILDVGEPAAYLKSIMRMRTLLD